MAEGTSSNTCNIDTTPALRAYRKPRAIITQRHIWEKRAYGSLLEAEGHAQPVLFWEDLTPEKKQRMIIHVRSGIVTALEAIPL